MRRVHGPRRPHLVDVRTYPEVFECTPDLDKPNPNFPEPIPNFADTTLNIVEVMLASAKTYQHMSAPELLNRHACTNGRNVAKSGISESPNVCGTPQRWRPACPCFTQCRDFGQTSCDLAQAWGHLKTSAKFRPTLVNLSTDSSEARQIWIDVAPSFEQLWPMLVNIRPHVASIGPNLAAIGGLRPNLPADARKHGHCRYG